MLWYRKAITVNLPVWFGVGVVSVVWVIYGLAYMASAICKQIVDLIVVVLVIGPQLALGARLLSCSWASK